jgi:hypothetical protein
MKHPSFFMRASGHYPPPLPATFAAAARLLVVWPALPDATENPLSHVMGARRRLRAPRQRKVVRIGRSQKNNGDCGRSTSKSISQAKALQMRGAYGL